MEGRLVGVWQCWQCGNARSSLYSHSASHHSLLLLFPTELQLLEDTVVVLMKALKNIRSMPQFECQAWR